MTSVDLTHIGTVGPVAGTSTGSTLATRDQLDAFTDAWLTNRRLAEHTRTAYRLDLTGWLDWCGRVQLDPMAARFTHVNTYARELESAPRPGTGRPLSAATVARKLAAVSSWYAFLVKLGAVTAGANPVADVDRPRVDRDDSPTIGLTGEQATVFMRAARAGTGPAARRDAALLGMLAELGLRVGEALALDMGDFRHNRGHRTVRLVGKGGHRRELPIPAPLGRDLDAYLAERAAAAGVAVEELAGRVFVTSSGRPVDQPAVFRTVRRIARAAGLAEADRLSPHSLRHTAITAALDAGAQLRDVQDFAGHADPRTTRGYDRGRGSLDRSPAYLVARLFAHDDDQGAA